MVIESNYSKVIICVDDGHPLDLKIAEILRKKKFQAIFYIPINNADGKPTLKKKEIRYLSKYFEIGSHTYNHIDLTSISTYEARKEMEMGKQVLEDIIGKKVKSFAPPRGKYSGEIVDMAKEIGIKDFRTADILNTSEVNRSNFLWYPNLHVFPHGNLVTIKHLVKRANINSLYFKLRNIKTAHLDLFGELKQKLDVVYLWLHSWEIEQENLWTSFDNLLSNYQ